MERYYKYEMGFMINDTPIPDPSYFTGAASDLDTLGERDSYGDIRRNKIATKYHSKLEWANIDWEMAGEISHLLADGDRFNFTYIDPVGGGQKIIAYCGDREWEAVLCTNSESRKWLCTLKVSIIEI